jgi:hypothetical protein
MAASFKSNVRQWIRRFAGQQLLRDGSPEARSWPGDREFEHACGKRNDRKRTRDAESDAQSRSDIRRPGDDWQMHEIHGE